MKMEQEKVRIDQEKFAKMNQPATNSNMPRDTVETLKQIQKQGLSISIVGSTSGSFSLPSPASKQIADKASKVPPRSQAASENKGQVLQSRLSSTSETRVSSSRSTTQSPANQSRVSQTAVSEAKGFSPNWSGSNTSAETKTPGNANRPMQTTPVNKLQGGQARLSQLLMTESKTPISRNNQSMLSENKTPCRVTQSQRVTQNQQMIENKIQSNQERVNVNPTSPPDAKVFSNQVRTSQQQFIVTQENKVTPGQRIVSQKTTDVKITNQISTNKQIEVKTTPINRVIPIPSAKVLPDSGQGKLRPAYIVKTDGKSPAISAPMLVENKMIRMVANVVDSGAARTPQGKACPTQMRLHQNISGSEISTSGGHVKIIQSIPLHSDKLAIQANKVSASDQKSTAAFEVSPDTSLGNAMSVRTPVGKRTASVFSPAKKKCVKRTMNSSDMSSKIENNNSSEDVNENEEQFFNTLKSNRGLTITPVRPPGTSTPIPASNSSCVPRVPGELLEKDVFRVLCPSCNNYSLNPKWCQTCKCNLNSSVQGTQQSTEVVQKLPGTSFVVTKNVTNVMVSKHIIYNTDSDALGQTQRIQFGQTVQKKILIKSSPVIQTSPRGKAKPRSRRRYVEPVCLTLSSDDEEEHIQSPFNTFMDENLSQSAMFPQESEGSKSGHSSPVYQDEENPESDDPQFPGVTDIHPKHMEGKVPYEEEEEEEEEKDMEEMEFEEEEEDMPEEEEEEIEESEGMDEEEDEEVPPEEEDGEDIPNKGSSDNISGVDNPLPCRSVRIGSFKVHPKPNNSFLHVYMSMDGLSFKAPMITDPNKIVNVILKPNDITQMFVHFGRCLPIVFIFTTPTFAEALRKSLNIQSGDYAYFDPNSNDEKQKKITLLIDSFAEDQRRFLRHTFLPEKKVTELDQKTANEILVKSTPNQNAMERIKKPFPASTESQITLTPLQPVLSNSNMKITPVIAPPQPVTKLFTYPPPPQTGGIAVTNEDLACLNEGEFLNDAIIDFYLKYVYYEKLSEYHREKTHIFSSYFYPRLTHKPERSRPGEDGKNSVQMRRHSQVKTWTRHVDIFSKDFIIIPVNQNVHWFLAIICYPGLVADPSDDNQEKPDSKNNKSSDNVTSTDDQEENKAAPKEANSTVDGNNQNSDENSTASSNSVFEPEEPDSEEPMPEAPDSSTHPDKNRRRKEAPCICIFDSLNGPNRWRIATMLREYLEVEWKMKKGSRKVFDKNTMQGFIMQCPQQTNYSDCGIYLLQYVESFFENPIPYFDSPIPNLTYWFPKERVAKKRQELKDLILNLQKQQATNSALRKNNTSDNVLSSPAQPIQTENR